MYSYGEGELRIESLSRREGFNANIHQGIEK